MHSQVYFQFRNYKKFYVNYDNFLHIFSEISTVYVQAFCGLEPLSEFLNKPIPNKYFPQKNKGRGIITQEVVNDSYIFDPIKKGS